MLGVAGALGAMLMFGTAGAPMLKGLTDVFGGANTELEKLEADGTLNALPRAENACVSEGRAGMVLIIS